MKPIAYFLFLFLFIIGVSKSFAQPFQVCNAPGANSCKCSTAPVLCTIGEIDNYTFQMSTYQHPADGPSPMCPGGNCPPGQSNSTASQNPTWVAFRALCSDFTVTLSFSGCSGNGCNRGLQAAIYASCSNLPGSVVDGGCSTCYNCNQGIGCGTASGQRVMDVSGLVPGQIYHLLVDGCGGSACTVTIDVDLPPGCVDEIGPWTGPLNGPSSVCVGDTATYWTNMPVGGTNSTWVIKDANGNPIDPPLDDGGYFLGPPPFTKTRLPIQWNTVGTYQICVDVYNSCVPASAAPAELCKTINVYDVDAGTITAVEATGCPGREVDLTVTGHNTSTGVSQYILVVNSSGQVVQVTLGANGTFTYDGCGSFTAYSYNIVTDLIPPNTPVVGQNISSIISDCDATCCELASVPFSFSDTSPPVFTNPPPNITVSCIDNVPPMEPLDYTDNCLPAGSQNGVETGSPTNCGGSLTRTWTITDGCNNTKTHTQTITITPTPPATFTPFNDVTVSCADFPPTDFLPVLNYSNNQSGACLISGSITPTRVVDTTNCVGTVTYTWETTDFCGRTISDQQVYTIQPPPVATFTPFADVTVSCVDAPPPTFMPVLTYTNGQTGQCEVSGSIVPERTENITNCAGTITYTWSANDRCGRPIFEQQVFTVQPPPVISFVNPPPSTGTLQCAQIPAPDVLPPLAYDNGSTEDCRIYGTVIPERTDNFTRCGGSITYNWSKTDSCGRFISYAQILTVLPSPPAAFINPPASVTYPCGQLVPPDFLPTLSYSNGLSGFCEIAGSVIPTRVDNVVGCTGSVTLTWNFTDECNRSISHTQVITLSPPDLPAFINPPANITVACPEAPDPDFLPTLDFTNGSSGDCLLEGTITAVRTGELVNCQGVYTYTWEFTDYCDRTITHIQTVTIQPPTPATFINPPANITVACPDAPDPDELPTLEYANGMTGDCGINGSVQATRTGELVNCAGVYTYTWTITDQCNRVLTHTRTITIQAPTPATFINPPANITVACPDAPDPDELPTLEYANGMTGDCGINGSVQATRTGELVNCAGVYTYTWTITDQCNRVLTHTRTITIQAPTPATFINPPANITVACPDAPDPDELPSLEYANGMTGDCGINGSVQATRTGELVNCAGTYTYTWTITDQCNRVLTHTRTITIQAPTPATFINPPANITVACPDAPDPDELPTLEYANGMTGDCGINGSVQATRTGELVNCAGTYTYTWTITDQCNRVLTHTRTITIQAPTPATFINPPANITVACPDAPDPDELPTLEYANGMTGDCGINGSVQATRTGELVNCAGTYTYTWQITDQCNRVLLHTRTVTIQPPTPATFIDPPANITVSCQESPDPDEFPELNYTNGMTGDCGINGSVPATRTGDLVNCAGTYTYTWQFTDQCNRLLSHTRTITILPPPPATYINPPSDITVACSSAPDPSVLPVLNYTNGLTGDCAITGEVQPTVNITGGACDKVFNYQWNFTDPCGRLLQWSQTITVLPPPEAQFINPPAPLLTLNCEEEPAPDFLPSLNYSNNSTGQCLIEGTVVATKQEVQNNCAKTITYNWVFTDFCGRSLTYSQILNILPPPAATLINPPVYNTPLSCDEADTATFPAIAYSNNSSCIISGTLVPNVIKNFTTCGGNIQVEWSGVDICGRQLYYNQIILVNPAPVPTITTPLPVDITVQCQDIASFVIPLTYSNGLAGNCARSGILNPTVSGNSSLCGGIVLLKWEGQDACGYAFDISQQITIEPAPEATFQNVPPPSITTVCTSNLANPPVLSYSNGQTGFCSISGSVIPIQTGGYTACGGTIQYTWQFTDACGRSIVFNQDVQVLPAPDPEFINVPTNVVLPCGQGFGNPPALNYTNGQTGLCGITGQVNPVTTDLGNTRIYTWVYTNPCNGIQITAEQEVSLRPVPSIVVAPNEVEICYGESFDLSDIEVTDLNGSSFTLTYHNNIPPGPLNQTVPIITTDFFTTYYINAVNSFGCSDYAEVNFSNVYPPNAGTGEFATLCKDGSTVNLWEYIIPPYDNNGYWNDTESTGINISDPASVSFNGFPAGNYIFEYIVPSDNICPDAVATVQLLFVNPGTYQIQEVFCAPDFQTYTVRIIVQGYSVQTSAGTISSSGNIRTISNIPIGQSVTLTLNATTANCAQVVVNVDPPQCNCPPIGLPVSGGDKKACQGQSGVALSVTVPTGLSASWFDAASGGNLVQSKALSYAPATTSVGIRTFYAEAIDTVTNCRGSRIPIVFEVLPNPVARDTLLQECDDNNDGITMFNLNDAKPLLISGSSFTFDFYTTLADATSETNKIADLNYTNTVNDQVLYVSVKNVNGCRDIAQLTLHVLPLPTVTYTVQDESCKNAGDGRITINPPFQNLEFRLNALPWTTSTVFQSLTPNTYTLRVRDTFACTSQYNVLVRPGQELYLGSFSISCSDNGTNSNGADDSYQIRFVVNAINGLSTTYSVFYQGTDLGDFTYGVQESITLPANGGTGILIFRDNITNCEISKEIGPLDPCSTTCEITINGLSVTCSDSGTDADPADDIYTISFTASVVNGGNSTGFIVLINGVISGTYNYNVPVSFQIPATSNPPVITVRDLLNIQCSTVLQLGNLQGCSGACDLSYTISNILCNDQGTINDPADDTYTFTIRVTGLNTSNSWVITGSNTAYPYNTNITLGPYLISQGVLNLVIRDQQDNACTENVTVNPPTPCSEPCVLSVTSLSIGQCNNNNTNNTPADDIFSTTFRVNVISGFTNFYNVKFGNQTFGPFVYGNLITINGLPATGQSLTLLVEDALNPGCVAQIVVSQTPCSQCVQTVSAGQDIQLTCSQNEATLSGTASAPGGIFVWTGPNGFNKTGQIVTTSAEGQYTLTVTFPDQCVVTDVVSVFKDANLPVANAGPDKELTCNILEAILTGSSSLTSNVTYTWTNAAGQVISTSQNVNVNATGFYYLEVLNTLNNCKSGKDEVEVFNRNQQLTFNTTTWICDNKSTSSTGDDDVYTVTFNLSNTTNATNQFRVLEKGVDKGTFSYNQNFSFTVPADGSEWEYEFVDLVTGCKTTTKVGPLISCSTNCLISYDDLEVQCNDNGTESDETDDFFTISFTATALNSGISNSFRVTLDGVEKGVYNYGNTVMLTLPADRKTPFLVLEDLNISACREVIPIPALIPCSSICAISGTISNILCNDNGTINDPSDDRFSFDVIVQGVNTSASWIIAGKTDLYNYGERITLGPFAISGGAVTLKAEDTADGDCEWEFTVQPPPVCSEPCVIQMADLNVLPCNNNETGNTAADDFFNITFRINRISGSAGKYEARVGQQVFGPFIYGDLVTLNGLPANGALLTVLITDPSNSGCTTSFTVSKPPCSTCNQTVNAGPDITITCQQTQVTLTGSSSQPGTYSWTGPAGFNQSGLQVQTNQPGTYIFTAVYADQCTAKDSLVVSKDSGVPDANAGIDTTLNCKVTSITLNGITNLIQNFTATWTDAAGNVVATGNNLTITTPGSYFFEVINTVNNCTSGKDEVTIVQDIEKPEAIINADPGNLLDCIVGTIVLSGKPVANVIFNWQTGETIIYNQNSITANTEGIYTMTALDTINGCENLASIEIIDLQDYPILSVEPVEPITCENNGVVINAGNSPDGPNLVYSWFDSGNNLIPGQTGDTLYVTTPGVWYVVLTDTTNNCSNRDTVQVERLGQFPSVSLPDDITLYCGQTQTQLTSQVLAPVGPVAIQWMTDTGKILDDSSKGTVKVDGEGVYTVEVTYTDSGCRTTDRVRVNVDRDFPRAFLAEVSDETCQGKKDGSISVAQITGGRPPYTYSLNGSSLSGTGVFTPLNPGSYRIAVTDANGCKKDSVIIVDEGSDLSLSTLSPVEIIYNQSQTLEVKTNLTDAEIKSVRWTPADQLGCDDCLITTIQPVEDKRYLVVVTDIYGCEASATVVIRVKDNSMVTIPNIINPDGNSNKYLVVYGNENVLNVESLTVYDRWGNLIFTKQNFKPNIPQEGWDGTMAGKPVTPGVYVYKVDYLSPSGIKTMSGDVTVIK